LPCLQLKSTPAWLLLLLCLCVADVVLPQEQQLPLTLQGIKQLIRDNFKAHSVPNTAEPDTQQQQQQQQQHYQGSGRVSPQQQLSPLDQGFAALRALPQQVYLEACSSSRATEGVLVEATSCFNPRADPFTSAGVIVGGSSSSSSSREQWFSYRIRITNHRQHCIKVLGRGWVIESHLGELEGFVQLAADNGVVGQQPVILPGACFEYYSCSSLKRFDAPGLMKGHLLVSLLGPAEQQQQDSAEEAAAAADSPAKGAQQQQQQEDATSSSSSSGRRAAAEDEVEIERVAVPVGVLRLQSPATAAAAVAAARMRAPSSASCAESQDGGQPFAAAASEEEGSSSSSSSDDDSSKR
jgi:uncharacterized protein affecting Mg2+/Co2+ transport